MDCNECKLEMVNLFDKDIDHKSLTGLLEHIQHCLDCANEYHQMEEILSGLKPKTQLNAPNLLKRNIINQLSKMEEMKNNTSRTIGISSKVRKILSIAAILAVVLIITPFVVKNDAFMNSTAKAADIFITSSIEATHRIKSMFIKLRVRTISDDSFALVGTEYPMVDHTIWKSFENPVQWRVDKGERVAAFDGKSQYLWLPKTEEAIKAGAEINFTEWLQILLDPANILSKEQKSTKERGSKLTINEKNGLLNLTITSKARGNFINDYCKNKSIDESDNRREYTFDNASKLLKGLKIYILDGKKETLIVEITSIDYDLKLDPSKFVINLPAGVEWKEYTQNYTSETFRNITSRRVAELFFAGMARYDWKLVGEACDFFSSTSEKAKGLKDQFGGLKVIKIGEPFKSGLYPGEFVPYEIRLKTGEIVKHNLAVRNDNPRKTWIVDGGY